MPGQRSPWQDVLLEPFGALGQWTLSAITAIGQTTDLLFKVTKAIFRQPPRRRVILMQAYQIGYLSLPIVILTGIAIALVLAVQAHAVLKPLAAQNMVGAMVNFAMVSELAPVFTGIMLSGRVGSAIAAEIGTMKVTEQLDALRVMGTDPIAFLVAPRFLACVLLLPVLCAISAWSGIFCAEWLATSLWDLDGAAYNAHAETIIRPYDIFTGYAKTIIFGGIIALVACRKGLQTTGGATGVGTACTEGVVIASTLILGANFILTLLIKEFWRWIA
ncbi:MAG: ABC transporter permease [Epibacterium sp.]|nr:ABC transporter permease [Epibacterium sp.]NQX75711.1 ABC transporter permease [Epibacterium sp.]